MLKKAIEDCHAESRRARRARTSQDNGHSDAPYGQQHCPRVKHTCHA
jgi:hypothetical protein